MSFSNAFLTHAINLWLVHIDTQYSSVSLELLIRWQSKRNELFHIVIDTNPFDENSFSYYRSTICIDFNDLWISFGNWKLLISSKLKCCKVNKLLCGLLLYKNGTFAEQKSFSELKGQVICKTVKQQLFSPQFLSLQWGVSGADWSQSRKKNIIVTFCISKWCFSSFSSAFVVIKSLAGHENIISFYLLFPWIYSHKFELLNSYYEHLLTLLKKGARFKRSI